MRLTLNRFQLAPHGKLTFILLVICMLHPALSQGPPGQPAAPQQTTATISTDQLKRIAGLVNGTLERLSQGSGTYVDVPFFTLSSSLSERMKVYFRALMGNDTGNNELLPVKNRGRYTNSVAQVVVGSQINEPFVSKIPAYAFSIPQIVREITNGSVQVGDQYSWVGGSAFVFDMGESRCYVLMQSSVSITVRRRDGSVVKQTSCNFIRSEEPFRSVLISMGLRNGPILLEGTGAVLGSTATDSQRLWLTSSSRGKVVSSFGNVSDTDFNSGNGILPLTEDELQKLEMMEDQESSQGAGVENIDTGKEYAQGLEQYDNMAFLTLSVAAILSSAAVAAVSIGHGYDRVILIVEATVVYSFLVIVSHALVVLLRRHTFVADIGSRTEAKFVSGDLIVEAQEDTVIALVGERLHFPLQLVVTEVFAVIAACAVTFTVYWTLRQFRVPKKQLEGGIPRNPNQSSGFLSFVSLGSGNTSQQARNRGRRNPTITKRISRSLMIINFSGLGRGRPRRLKP